MALGTIRWFSIEKGFGFIAPMDGSAEVRFHAAAIARADLELLVEGRRVRYELGAGEQRIAEHLALAG